MFAKGMLVLHKSEWDKLSRMQKVEESTYNQNYIKSLNDMSQSWIKSWPDTAQGLLSYADKQKEIQREKNIAFINKYLSQRKDKNHNRKELSKKAKEQIFEDTCYGRRLISALKESKTLEERDMQIEFQKKIKYEAKLLERRKPPWTSIESAPDMEKKENQIKHLRQEKNKEVVEINKAMSKSRREREIKEKQKEASLAKENWQAIKHLEVTETQEKNKIKEAARKELKQFIKEQKASKNVKTKQELEIDRKIEEVQKHQDRLKCKIKNVYNKIIKEQCNNNNTTKVYNRLQNIKQEEQKRFDKFIASGMNKKDMYDFDNSIISANQLQRKSKETKRNISSKKLMISSKKQSTEDKTKPETVINNEYSDKCVCERQCLITKSFGERKCTKIKKALDLCNISNFTKPKNVLLAKYNQRQKEKTHWTGLQASHKHFADQASAILRECRYKKPVINVVNDYRRLNCLDDQTLPITNF